VGVFNGMIMEVGLLTGQDPRQAAARNGKHPYDPAKVERAAALHAWASERGLSTLTLNLQFSVRKPWVAATLVGASRPEEIEADVRAYLQPVPESAWDDIERLTGFSAPNPAG
jgi:aryl-alcohol dehydrogenase-like predicted oxidoreductase